MNRPLASARGEREELPAGEERPLRVVQAAAFGFPSMQGSQVYVRGMARALARRGHQVTVACYAHSQGEPDPEYDVVRTPSVPGYARLRAGPDLVKPLLDLALARVLARQVADIVHVHNYEAPLSAILARPWQRAPLVYSAHNTMGDELHTYFEGRLARRLARLGGRALDRTVPRLADHAIAISPDTVPVLEGLGCRAVSCVPPGVDPEDLAPARPLELPPGPWVIYAGNPDRYQDLDVLVAAMRRLPEVGLLLVSASPLDEFEGLGLPRLRCLVTEDFQVVRRALAAADLAALPRATCRGFPIKLLNYLGMGLPTVAAAGSAPPMPGLVRVADRDPEAMAGAIRSLCTDSTRRRALGVEARAHVLEHCTWAARGAELEALYRSLLRGRGRPAGA